MRLGTPQMYPVLFGRRPNPKRQSRKHVTEEQSSPGTPTWHAGPGWVAVTTVLALDLPCVLVTSGWLASLCADVRHFDSTISNQRRSNLELVATICTESFEASSEANEGTFFRDGRLHLSPALSELQESRNHPEIGSGFASGTRLHLPPSCFFLSSSSRSLFPSSSLRPARYPSPSHRVPHRPSIPQTKRERRWYFPPPPFQSHFLLP